MRYFAGRLGWGPVVPGVCTVHRLVLTPTVTTFEHHAALCPPIKFLCSSSAAAPQSTAVPQQFRSSSAAVPQQFRSSSAAAPQLLRSSSAVVPCYLRSRSVLPPQSFRVTSGYFAAQTKRPHHHRHRLVRKSPASSKFCLASGGCKLEQNRPWVGLVDLSRIPIGIFFPGGPPCLVGNGCKHRQNASTFPGCG